MMKRKELFYIFYAIVSLLPCHETCKNVKQCLRERSKLFKTESISEDTA